MSRLSERLDHHVVDVRAAADERADLRRRLVAEAVGTGLLVVAVVGSGIMAARLSPNDLGLELLENAAATAGALIGLILVFGAVSGAHFNPVVTAATRFLGGLGTREAVLYVVAQVVGGGVGTVLANVMFDLGAISWSANDRATTPHFVSEVLATFALVVLIFGLVRSGRAAAVPYAVGAWIGAAYWFTSSTSFANPAVTIARMFSDTFAGIAPRAVPWFIVAQVLGGAIALALVRYLYPRDLSETDHG
jgi:glycerol uptake facilitator-like aquaporin